MVGCEIELPEVGPSFKGFPPPHATGILSGCLWWRKSWLFNWTEIGAERVGFIQSLLTTCRLHDIHPYTYLVDVLQRVAQHRASRVDELTPRNWKRLFSDNPLRSDLQLADQD